ncbi:hypothetical protein PCC9214_01756 [Planktothrix tepida]|uniref:Secreted protein n=1 Tax=Planktothrix tepida PCC 9214 TaxID=671072 RepID=A0A1J1LNW8_9CYAN|nr:hypothetical protein [Planktothrix tepida]CAD5938395.1 hypothetical protein PCC9214_01756 [Planktothrix tepida]CUR33281.1 conserved exported hypothetical protein [Planktothrix tepida PCC 9214]
MKKLLASIASASLFTVTALAATPSQAALFFGTDSTDLNDVFNKTDLNDVFTQKVSLRTEQTNVIYPVSQHLKITPTAFLETPPSQTSSLSTINTTTIVNLSSPPGGKMIYSKAYGKGVCNVHAGCALQAIGLSLALQCSNAGTDPEAWAKCVKSKDYDKYLAAAQCTWGTCPGFATLPNGGAAYACTSPSHSILEGKS